MLCIVLARMCSSQPMGLLQEGKVRPIKSGSIKSLIDINEADRQLGEMEQVSWVRKGWNAPWSPAVPCKHLRQG